MTYQRKTKSALWVSAGIGIESKPVVQPDKSVVFVKRVKPLALWLSVAGAKPVRGPARPDAQERSRARFARKPVKSYVPGIKTRPGRAKARQTGVKSESLKRKASERAVYRVAAREFVGAAIAAGGRCPVVLAVPELFGGYRYGHPISARLNEVHHTRGRLGSLLLDQRFWIALSKAGHRWVHEHPDEARRRGWLCDRGEWNTLPKSF